MSSILISGSFMINDLWHFSFTSNFFSAILVPALNFRSHKKTAPSAYDQVKRMEQLTEGLEK